MNSSVIRACLQRSKCFVPSSARRCSSLSHVDSDGKARMVDVSAKAATSRTAVATAVVDVGEEAFGLVRENAMKKGDVLGVAQLAGIMGAKKTSELIPLCHPLPLDQVEVRVKLGPAGSGQVEVECTARTTGRTGVEMEAMAGASVAALAVYDMCKAVAKGAVVREVKLVSKTGGKSGDYVRRDGSEEEKRKT